MAQKERPIEGWTSISIPIEWIPQIMQICKVKKYTSASEFVREAIRNQLKREVGIRKND